MAMIAAGCAQTQGGGGGAPFGGSSALSDGGGGLFAFDGSVGALSYDGSGGMLGASTTGTCTGSFKSIAISPPTLSTQVMYGAAGPSVQQQFTATGTSADGSTHDITGCATWSTSAPDLSMVPAGSFSTTTAGQYTVTVTSGMATATAVATVKLVGVANASNIDTTKLDGTPAGMAPTIAYPLDGSLFPFQFGDLSFQIVPGAATQTVARIAFEGDAIDIKLYAPCTPIPNAVVAGACAVALPANLEPSLAGASEGVKMSETVRVAAADGSNLGESVSIDARWASSPLPGSIYYWSSPPATMAAASEIIRMNLANPGTPPEVFYQWLDADTYSDVLSGGWACIGCHSISQDGKKMGIVLNGAAVNPDGQGALFALVDVATRAPTAARITDDGGQQILGTGFATFTSFSPDDATMVQALQGQLYLRTADATLASQPLFAGMTEKLTHPYWSSKGDLLAFTSWVPSLTIPHSYDSKDLNGNETPNSQIWTASVTGTTFANPTVLVPRVPNASEFYPTISDDSAYVVFNESSCSGPPTPSIDGYGSSPCDSYDDPSARLRLISATGGAPVELDRASGRTAAWPMSGTWGNSWPRFSPSHSTFQGKSLYWVAFSSRRAYGATLAGSQGDGSTVPQIWFAGIVIDPKGQLTGDPSFSPVWLPQQNSPTPEVLWDGGTAAAVGNGKPTGNHVPQWVYTYVPYVPPQMPPPAPPR